MDAHPEIGRWLRRGPMANMPDAYQEVVRDIMLRYGEWTERQDPMSKLMEEYSKLASWEKQDFLVKHPELVAYWRSLRTGHERVLYDLAQRYFMLQDPAARKAFIGMHPELQEYFQAERKRRYEEFLDRVAQYMGHYPDLANRYLREQTDMIHELIGRYGKRPLVAETAAFSHRESVRDRS
jgi:hypothetical protein